MNISSPFALVETERLILRTPRLEDEAAVFTIHAAPETNQFNPAGPMKNRLAASESISRWIDDWSVHGLGYWCVTTKSDQQIIGVSGVRRMEWSDRQVLNLYYRYAPQAWGKGFALEAAAEAIKAAVSLMPELPVVARTRPNNQASIRVAERVGLQRHPDLDSAEHVVYTRGW